VAGGNLAVVLLTALATGPSPVFSSRGGKNQEGPKARRGGHIFKIQYWMYVATGGQT